MSQEKPRLARLTAILTQLQSRRLVTATELAREHGVSVRTIYRDIRTLEQSGVPIVVEEGKGYSILDTFRLPPVHFSEEEANALITAEQLIARNKDQSLVEHYRKAVTKLKATLNHHQQQRAGFLEERMQVRDNFAKTRTSDYLIRLQSCIARFQVVRLDYVSLSGEQSQREVEPFAVYTTQENWILIAMCRMRMDFRSFRLDCIHHLQETGKEFAPHPMTLEEFLESCRKKYETPDIPLTP